ncbi:MAG TPA: hypothetical protein VFC63_24985 [Blastocatellia bacterium]|nr:hypothetical protein [Blastocatellia bacterium]
MLSCEQTVVTKYGPGVVVYVSKTSSNVYVRVNNRAGAIYVFHRNDLSPLHLAISNDSIDSHGDCVIDALDPEPARNGNRALEPESFSF